MYFIGIDSGLSGAISVLDKNGDLYDLIKVPLEKIEDQSLKHWYDKRKLFNYFNQFKNNESKVVLEMQQVMQGQGIVSSGRIMRGFGLYEGLLACLFPNTSCIVKAVNWQNFLNRRYIKNDEIYFKPKTKNLELIAEKITDNDYKEWFLKVIDNKSTQIAKFRSAYLYYVITMLSDCNLKKIKYTNNNIVDAYLISRYAYESYIDNTSNILKNL